jgi:hypothetical protein
MVILVNIDFRSLSLLSPRIASTMSHDDATASNSTRTTSEDFQSMDDDHSTRPLLAEMKNATDAQNDVPFNLQDWFVTDRLTEKRRLPRQNEFLRLMLCNTRYSSYVSWSDQAAGIFKFLEPERVAALWQQVKGRRTKGTMNYEKFARGIRFYYPSGSMIKMHKKYTFRFGLAT